MTGHQDTRAGCCWCFSGAPRTTTLFSHHGKHVDGEELNFELKTKIRYQTKTIGRVPSWCSIYSNILKGNSLGALKSTGQMDGLFIFIFWVFFPLNVICEWPAQICKQPGADCSPDLWLSPEELSLCYTHWGKPVKKSWVKGNDTSPNNHRHHLAAVKNSYVSKLLQIIN